MWRAGFGPIAGQLQQFKSIEPISLYQSLKKTSSKKPEFLDAADTYLKGLWNGISEETRKEKMSKEDQKNIQQKSRESIRSLNLMWLDEMIYSKSQLREKISLFWHGHFASRNLNIFYQQNMLDVIRNNALGSFRDLLHEVSKTGAILNFLNANQNRKDHPNENFAREVMELFTLGRGNYTEQDVKEAARAFTGWGANLKGDFVFRKPQHDAGTKTILGKTGKFNGDDVLDIILDKPATAYFISYKIYRFFVNENADMEKVEWLGERFYQSNYNISQLMEDIFTSQWFYDEKNIGTRIKSPIELIAGMRRMLPMELENEESQLLLQRLLGQVLFYPPNVAGWPGGKTWIDSSTLMMRMRLPRLINDQDELNIKPKEDDDQSMGKMMNAGMAIGSKPIKAKIEWTSFIRQFDSISREQLISQMNLALLQTIPGFHNELIRHYSDEESRDSFIRSATIQIMSTPEYQMC